ncbi:MAG: phage tail sheath C-terminal domain-containing protein [Pseudomonadota bacterium]
MALAYKTPGVYIEEIPKFPPIVSAVETAIPAFIGYTEKSIDVALNEPFRITSMVEYEQRFGLPQPEDKLTVTGVEVKDASGTVTGQKFTAKLDAANRSKYLMYYAVQMFFANGGGPCYIVSTGLYKAVSALVLTELQAGLKALEKVDEPTLLVFPEAQGLGIADFKTLMDAALAQCQLLKDRFVIMDVHGGAVSASDPAANIITIVDNFRDDGIGTNNLKYGAAYAPNLETVLDFVVDETKTDVSYFKAGALDTKKLSTLEAADNLVYESARAAIRDLPLVLPPSSAMAGIYAAVDASRGVWKAPANVSVNAVIKPTIEFTNRDQESVNDDPVAGKSVNAIRPFTGKGTLVWGARTLAGNDAEWRYVSVRRLFIFIEESCGKAAASFVFEPNDANTWVKLQAMLENFLTVLWRQGALQGAKPDHAFYVAVGLGKTMTAQDLLEGRMIVEIGIAAVRPAEFIILRFSHKLAQS